MMIVVVYTHEYERTDGVLAGFQPFMKLALLRNVVFKSPPVALSPPPPPTLFEDVVASTMVVTNYKRIKSDPTNEKESMMMAAAVEIWQHSSLVATVQINDRGRVRRCQREGDVERPGAKRETPKDIERVLRRDGGGLGGQFGSFSGWCVIAVPEQRFFARRSGRSDILRLLIRLNSERPSRRTTMHVSSLHFFALTTVHLDDGEPATSSSIRKQPR
jgi:hypothetical protein